METSSNPPSSPSNVQSCHDPLRETKYRIPQLHELRNAIPPYCFEPSTIVSLSYLVRDATLSVFLGAAAAHIPMISSLTARTALWALYGFLQGIIFTGIWIISHECGHGSFLKRKSVADVIGFTLHSVLLVPYFSWKFSHSRHHRFANHITRDMAFVPETRADLQVADQIGHDDPSDVPIIVLLRIILHQMFGWPMYLLCNITAGQESRALNKRSGWFSANHFDPTGQIFTWKEAPFVIASDLGVALVMYALVVASLRFGWQTMGLLYLQPWLWVNHWIVAITYLHHTHPSLPHYDASAWTFTKGALSTVDRDCGIIGRHFFHHITDTHVVHHLFPRIPFYHATEATVAIKPFLGERYHKESGSFMLAFWCTFRQCKFVEANPLEVGALKWNCAK